jgi:hypothetical protein
MELEEVEAHLRPITSTDLVATVAWPVVDGCASGTVRFQSGSQVNAQAAREAMRQRVPRSRVLEQIQEIDSMPLGSNGTIDRKALWRRLEQASAKADV